MPIVGFLLAGVVIGPHALGWSSDPALVNEAAEIGVILLLFTIGIEFSLEKLARIKTLIFGGGGLQVTLASAATMLALLARSASTGARRCSPDSWSRCRRRRSCSSCSATAAKPAPPHGQVRLGLLIFQDLAIIVMVLLVPMLGGDGGSGAEIVLGARQGARPSSSRCCSWRGG